MTINIIYQIQVSDQCYDVGEWVLTGYAFNQAPSCQLTLLKPHSGNPNVLLGQRATLLFGREIIFVGRIAVAEENLQPTGGITVSLRLASTLWPLQLKCFNRAEQTSSLRDRVTRLLQSHQLKPGRDFIWRKTSPTPIGLTSQINETDWAYFKHLCQVGQLQFCYRLQSRAGLYLFANWDDVPRQQWTLQEDNRAQQASLESIEVNGQQTLAYCFTTQQTGIQPGDTLRFNQAPPLPGLQNNPQLRVIGMSLRGCSHHRALRFQSRLFTLPCRERVATQALQRNTHLGLQLAVIAGTQAPSFDNQGRYWVQFRHAMHNQPDQQQGPLYLASVHAGRESGWHFPLYQGTWVVCSCVDDKPDQWVILGVYPQPFDRRLLTADNAQQELLRTCAGHMLRLEDGAQANVTLSSPNNKQSLKLDPHGIHLQTQQQNIKLNAAQTATFNSTKQLSHCDRNYTVQIGAAALWSTGQGDLTLRAGKTLQWQTQAQLKCSIKQSLQWDAKCIKVSTNQQQIWQTQTGNVSWSAPTCTLQAKRDFTIASHNGNIILQNGAAKLVMNKNGDLSLQAKCIRVQGQNNLALEGALISTGEKKPPIKEQPVVFSSL